MSANGRVWVAMFVLGTLAAGCARREESGVATPEPATSGAPAQAPPVASADTLEFIARGNEPFWAITVTREGLRFQEPDRPEGVVGDYVSPVREGARRVWRTTLRDSVRVPLELAIEEKPCSDGMSDRTYAFAAVAKIGGRVFQGCAERR